MCLSFGCTRRSKELHKVGSLHTSVQVGLSTEMLNSPNNVVPLKEVQYDVWWNTISLNNSTLVRCFKNSNIPIWDYSLKRLYQTPQQFTQLYNDDADAIVVVVVIVRNTSIFINIILFISWLFWLFFCTTLLEMLFYYQVDSKSNSASSISTAENKYVWIQDQNPGEQCA